MTRTTLGRCLGAIQPQDTANRTASHLSPALARNEPTFLRFWRAVNEVRADEGMPELTIGEAQFRFALATHASKEIWL